uniref:Uncharacterized protein n=1 Tax=Anguilla anguilla TaxID=7936 RepID=A0A0E9WGW5_ANGAN
MQNLFGQSVFFAKKKKPTTVHTSTSTLPNYPISEYFNVLI